MTIAPTELFDTSSLETIIATNIRAEAARRGLLQKDIAEALGLTQGAISHKWAGRRAWTFRELDKIAALYGLEAWQLCKPSEYEESRRKSAANLSLLPRLDSNQRPSDNTTAQLSEIIHISEWVAKKSA